MVTEHPVLDWLTSFIGYMMSRLEVTHDGKTAYERLKGKQFGKKALWKQHRGSKMEKLNARWGYGVCLGMRERSGDIIVANEDARGIKYTRTAKGVPEAKR